MSDKKSAFVCFCVDGPTDIDTLHEPFEELFDKIGGNSINVDFRFALFQNENHGDITSFKSVSPENIEKMIYKYYFKQQDKSTDLGWADLTHIVHIIDIDGVYTSPDYIRDFTEKERLLSVALGHKDKPKKALYFEDHLAANDIKKIEERNKRKRQNIEYLLSLKELSVGKKSVGYSLYYFSTNLDHFWHGDANLCSADKTRKASEFRDCTSSSDDLIKVLANNPYCVENEYMRSWKYLRNRQGLSSLSRATNIHLLVNRIQQSTLDDWL